MSENAADTPTPAPLPRLNGLAGLFNDRQDLVFADVECPEWGLTVRVRGLTASERDGYESSLFTFDRRAKAMVANTAHARGRLAALGIVDDAGRRIFTEDNAKQLGSKNAAALDRVCEKIRELSGMRADAVEDAKGNSGGGPSAA